MLKLPFEKHETIGLLVLLLFAVLLRVVFFPIPGASNDYSCFYSWFSTAADYGPRVFYNVVWCDYAPFNVYIFWVFGSFAKTFSLFQTPYMRHFIKVLPTLFDVATVVLIFAFTRKRFDYKTALVTSAFYAFNPAVIFDSAVFGQVDAIYTLFLLLSLMLVLKGKPKLSAVAFTIGLLIKPQSIALAPLLIFLIFRKYGWRTLLTSLLTSTATIFAVILPFEWSNPITFLWNIYFGAYSGYGVTSANAFNIWALGGLWQTDTAITFAAGWIMFGLATVYVLYVLNKRLDNSGELLIIFSAFMLFFSFFMLPTRMHERYMFPVLSVLALMLPFSKKIRPIYITLTLTNVANMAATLYYHYYMDCQYIPYEIVLLVTLINLIVFIVTLGRMPIEFRGKTVEQTHLTQSLNEKQTGG
jgi:dolichyl-phosphate-mannose-protein mannosyltransferase